MTPHDATVAICKQIGKRGTTKEITDQLPHFLETVNSLPLDEQGRFAYYFRISIEGKKRVDLDKLIEYVNNLPISGKRIAFCDYRIKTYVLAFEDPEIAVLAKLKLKDFPFVGDPEDEYDTSGRLFNL